MVTIDIRCVKNSNDFDASKIKFYSNRYVFIGILDDIVLNKILIDKEKEGC